MNLAVETVRLAGVVPRAVWRRLCTLKMTGRQTGDLVPLSDDRPWT
jgi:hypothetical protein